MGMRPVRARGRRPGSSCRFQGWRSFRGRPQPLCGPEGAPARLPLQGHPREGIVLFMRWEEKIKLPCCFSLRVKRRKRVVLFLVAKVCSPCTAFKGRKGSMVSGHQSCPSFGQDPFLEMGNPHPTQPSEMWQLKQELPHPAACHNAGAVG